MKEEFGSIEELEEKLYTYVNKYHFEIRLKGLGYKTPVSNLEEKFKITNVKKLYRTLTT